MTDRTDVLRCYIREGAEPTDEEARVPRINKLILSGKIDQVLEGTAFSQRYRLDSGIEVGQLEPERLWEPGDSVIIRGSLIPQWVPCNGGHLIYTWVSAKEIV